MVKKSLDTDGPASAKSSSKRKTLQRAEFVGYANVTFDDAAKQRFEGWATQEGLFEEALAESVADGWQFTLKTDTNSGSSMVSVSRWDGGHPQAGIILTVRGRTPYVALWRGVWALTDYLAYDLLAATLPVRTRDDW